MSKRLWFRAWKIFQSGLLHFRRLNINLLKTKPYYYDARIINFKIISNHINNQLIYFYIINLIIKIIINSDFVLKDLNHTI